MAAKKYTPKDINKNGKLDQWEIKKYEIINRGKPQMGMGEQSALKPKFLKGIFSKDDGSMSTFGNVANAVGPLAGLVGIGKSIADLIRGGKPAMTDKQKKVASKARKKVSKLQDKYEKETGGNELAGKNTSNKGKRLAKREEKVRTRATKKFERAGNKPAKYVSDAQRKAVWASKKDGGRGNPNKK